MSKKRYVYFQPNSKDIKDKFGDCQVRALSKAPDAIPVEWLKQKRDSQSDPWDYLANAIDYILAIYKQEQEAR